ncbi:MAG: gliding motility-associated C-terminal domain-containing protein [Bacteroidota bacterium]
MRIHPEQNVKSRESKNKTAELPAAKPGLQQVNSPLAVSSCPAPVIDSLGPLTFCPGGSVMLAGPFSEQTIVSTVAGKGPGYADGNDTAARFSYPSGLVFDASGNMFITDQGNNRIRKMTPAGVVTTFAGSGVAGYADGVGTNAKFNEPYGIAIDLAGNLYVGDHGGYRVRKITPGGFVTTLAGSGLPGFTDGQGTAASMMNPMGIAVDRSGNVYVADYRNHAIRKITPGGMLTTFAGSGTQGYAEGIGTAAQFRYPVGVTTDALGYVYVVDENNHVIRRITPAGQTGTFAGVGYQGRNDAFALNSAFAFPIGCSLDPSLNLYVADTYNQLIRVVTRAGRVITLAGNAGGYADGLGPQAAFDAPVTAVPDGNGNLFVADLYNCRIRKVRPFMTYLWSNGDSTQNITATQPGVYTLRTIIAGCTSAPSNPVTVSFLSPPKPVVTGSGSVNVCVGSSITLTSSAATGNRWSTGDTTQSITADTAGTYTVYVTGAICPSEAADPVTVSYFPIPAAPTLSANGPTTFCSNSFVNISSSARFGNLWSNGDTTQSINVSRAGNYSVRNITNGCTSAVSNPVTVSIIPPETPVITAAGFPTICAGQSLTLSSSTHFGNHWSTGDTTQSISVSLPGTYTVYTDSGGICTSGTSVPVTVTVNPKPARPVITVSGNINICTGASVTLRSDYATGNIWSNGASTQSITVNAAGNYSVQSIVLGCTSDVSNVVAVNLIPLPPAPTISTAGQLSFCVGGSVTLTSSSATGNVWSTGETTQSITIGSTGTFSVRQVQNGCTSVTSASVIVDVTQTPPVPVISTNSPLAICEGGSVTLTVSASQAYIWSNGERTQNITVRNPGTYTVRVLANGCTSGSSAGVTVSVTPVPAAPVISPAGNVTFCIGANDSLYSDNATGNLWSTGSTERGITVRQPGTYTVRRVLNGCTSVPSAAVTVSFGSVQKPVLRALGPLSFCSGDSVVLISSLPTNNLWSNGSRAGSITVRSPGKYYLRASNNGCQSAPDSVTVNVFPVPGPVSVSPAGPISLCSGGSVLLTLPDSALTGYTHLWTYNGAPAGSFSQLIANRSGNYAVSIITASGCTSALSNMVSVTITPPIPKPLIKGPKTLCGSQTGNYSVDPSVFPAGSAYSWSTSGGVFTTSDMMADVQLRPLPGQSSAWLRFTVTSGQCSNTDSMKVGFNTAPPELKRYYTNLLCTPTEFSVYYPGNEPLDTGIHWQYPIGLSPKRQAFENGNTVFYFDLSAAARPNDTLFLINKTCNLRSFILVPAESTPGAPVIIGDTLYCTNDAAYFIVKRPDPGPEDPDTKYLWTVSSDFTSESSTGSVFRFNINYLNGGSATVKVTLRKMLRNCESLAEQFVTFADSLCPDVSYNNVITPNSDTRNDYLEFKNLPANANAEVNIFNRWGEKVYSGSNYKNNFSCADCPAGIYYVVYKYNGRNGPVKGSSWIDVLK